jgi:hypothetical protein
MKNSLVCVIFKEKKSTIVVIIAHYKHELVFSGDFQGQEGVRIM